MPIRKKHIKGPFFAATTYGKENSEIIHARIFPMLKTQAARVCDLCDFQSHNQGFPLGKIYIVNGVAKVTCQRCTERMTNDQHRYLLKHKYPDQEIFKNYRIENRIQMRRKLTQQEKTAKLAEHSDGHKVRDVTVSLPDAIHACSYLRNFMTAHAFSSNTPRLGPYEVFNVQSVARRLILSNCKLWNVWTDDLGVAI